MIPRLSITKLFFILLLIYPFIVSASLLVPISSTLTKHHKSCSDIETHPDQCAFVMNTCHGFSGVFLRFYYCSTLWKPLSVTIMLSGLLLLFGAVSVVAADFFCPNLQTISSRLQLSESMAGVTVLAFGNGSPDLFSTFTAMNSGSGSLAIGELIGAAFFIVSVVSGCMGIIRPFRSKRITFMRDASFLTGAIMILTWIVYHQRICWYHGFLLILYYITYVIVVVLGAYRGEDETEDVEVVVPVLVNESKSIGMEHCNAEELLTETSRLLRSLPSVNEPLRLEIPANGFQSQEHLGHIIRPVSPNSSYLSRRSSLHLDSYFPRTTSTNGSISSRLYRHAMSPRVGIRTSLFSAIEFQEQVATIKRANSTQLYHPTMTKTRENTTTELRKRHTQASVPCISSARRRQESADHLLTINSSSNNHMHHQQQRHHHLDITPENSNNTLDDYFTYISNSSNHQLPVTIGIEVEEGRQPTPIPQITLDPAVTSPTKSARNEQEDDEEDAPSSTNTAVEEEGEDQDDHAGSLHVPLVSTAKQQQQDIIDEEQQFLKESASFSMILDDIFCTLFPTLSDWSHKTTFAKLSALVAVPLVLVFTLTLPVAEGEDVKVDDIEVTASARQEQQDVSTPQVVVITSGNVQQAANNKNYLTVPSATSERSLNDLVVVEEEGNPLLLVDDQIVAVGWSRWLTALQAICSITFVTSVMALNGFIPAFGILVGAFLGCILAILIVLKTKVNEAPQWHWMLSFVGFVIALNWIFLLANEMVGLLQALGTIFDISEAIMGLTIFALGNSVGDLVANTAIAKMGFPTMAISACYAGPLLNMVLGVGISSTYQTWITGKPYQLDIAPTILISSIGLITVLLSTLIVVNINGYHINRQLGWWMIIVYSTCTSVNVLLEFRVFF